MKDESDAWLSGISSTSKKISVTEGEINVEYSETIDTISGIIGNANNMSNLSDGHEGESYS